MTIKIAQLNFKYFGPCSVKASTFPLQGNRGVRIPHVSTIFYKLEFYIEKVL